MAQINGLETNGSICFISGSSVGVSVPSGGTNTYIDSIFIPGGSFKQNDVIQIQAAITRGSTTNTDVLLSILWNLTPDLLNTPVTIGSYLNNSGVYSAIHRSVCIRDNTTTIVGGFSSFETDLGDVQGNSLTPPISTITTIDWSVDSYIIVAAYSQTVTQTITKRYLTIIN